MNGDLTDRDIRRAEKSDLHTHFPLSGWHHRFIESIAPVSAVPTTPGLRILEQYITTHLSPYLKIRQHFEQAVRLGFEAAQQDNVTKMEMTLSVAHAKKYGGDLSCLVRAVKKIAAEAAPGCGIHIYAGIRREYGPKKYEAIFDMLHPQVGIEGIDLTGDEQSVPATEFRPLFKQAKNRGLRLKAHCGETGPADEVLRTVDMLNLDAIQHGIAVADSRAVSRHLADMKIPLHLAPASNYRIRCDAERDNDRLRRLIEGGNYVTIATDDLLLFGMNISDQIVHLRRSGVLTDAMVDSLLGRAT